MILRGTDLAGEPAAEPKNKAEKSISARRQQESTSSNRVRTTSVSNRNLHEDRAERNWISSKTKIVVRKMIPGVDQAQVAAEK
jgi:hypothetical protein